MLNPYDHEDADRLVDNVEAVVEPIAALVERAGAERAEVIYVNDNYGDWNSSRRSSRSAPSRGGARTSSSRSCRRTTRTS